MAATYADEAFERLYARYGREVYRYALALLRNPAEAEDVMQTTFLNAYRALRAGERPRRPHNWLIAIAHNACRSRVRFAMRRPKEVPLDDVVEQLAVPEPERPNIRELLRTIGRLPFNQRAAITMRELEGRSYVDIAETLGVSVPAAEALIGRARRTLRGQAARFRALTLLPSGAGKIAALLAVGAVGGGVGVVAGGGSGTAAAPRTQTVARPSPAGRHTSAVSSPRPRVTTGATPTSERHGSPSAEPPAPAARPVASTPAATAEQPPGTTLAEPAAAPAATTPPLTTPAVTTPAAPVPPVTVPPVTVPSVTVPSVTVPPVTVPSITVPTLP